MPSDSNGVFSLVSGYLAVTGETIQASQHNPVLEDIESAMSARLMRSGVAPMTGALKIVDGAVGSPAVQFNSASSTGFYKTANGIGVSVNGAKVAEFTSSGLSRMIGELIPWTLLSAPTGWVLPYGQTLSRTTYADLWAIAQTEISGGNTFYNNGNGTTTFGIGDLRGRVVAGKDDMGGSSAGRLTPAVSGGVTNSTILGSAGGAQSHALITAQLPAHTHTGTTGIESNDHTHGYTRPSGAVNAGTGFDVAAIGSSIPSTSDGRSASHTHSFTTNSTGSDVAHNNVQPTVICNYILYAGA